MMKEPLRILLVEDAPADAELIQYELRKANIEFSSKCVETKKAFAKEVKSLWPDVIISDFTLPQFNALDALRLLQGCHSSVPFILVTGSTSEEVAVECIKEGADDYILKSSLKRLPSAVLSLISKKRAEHERVKAENALRAREAHYRILIENISDVITIVNQDGILKYASPSIERVLGYTPGEVVGASALDFLHPDDLPACRERLRELNQSRIALKPIEHRFRHKDGSWRFFESVNTAFLDQSEIAGIVVNSREITERKRAEEQILEQAALLDKAQDAIMVVDLEEQISFWNKSAERLYGWGRNEIISHLSRNLWEANDQPRFDEARNSTLLRGEWHGELPQITKEKKALLVESRWSLVRDAEGKSKSILIINSDITEKKKLEAHFMRAQRMESIGTLAGGIAHDLNNVLTPIIMSIKLLRDELTEGSAQELLDTLETSAHRGAAIVQQVLSFARGVEGERAVFQFKHPLNEVIKIAKDIFPPLIHIRTRIAKDLWAVYGDPTQLHQVFMNLFVNARDAMPHGGRLQVEAENMQVDESYARMQPDAKAGAYVVVTVSDSGTGIPPGLISQIFEPFFTTKAVGKGTGLGLSTAMAIVKSHDGFLNVYSEVGKGTCFKVHLPAADQALVQPPSVRGQVVPQGRGQLILVVDDEVAVREIIKMTLEINGYRVLTANDGTEAVAVYAENKRDIQIVVVDIMMPYMDGPATMRALQKFDAKVKFIAISGLMENEKVAEMADLGSISFIAKPFTTEQLLITLAKVLKIDGNAPAKMVSQFA